MKNLREILAGCIQNNQRDQKALYEHYYGYALKIVFRYIFRYDKAVDVVNDAFIKVFSKLNTFHYDNTANLEMILMGWMRTILINTAIDRLRKDNFLPEIGALSDDVWIKDEGQSAEQSMFYKELVLQIKRLPPAYRVVFNMYVIDGFKHQEIASQLGITVGTSKSNLFKARAILQSFLKESDEQVKIC